MVNKVLNSHKDLIVWQKSVDLVVAIYKYTGGFPKEEVYGLVSQMRRCAVSIPSNIAEGRARGTRKDFRQFLIISLASATELETQLVISKKLEFGSEELNKNAEGLLIEIMRMLHAISFKLKANS